VKRKDLCSQPSSRSSGDNGVQMQSSCRLISNRIAGLKEEEKGRGPASFGGLERMPPQESNMQEHTIFIDKSREAAKKRKRVAKAPFAEGMRGAGESSEGFSQGKRR